MDALRLNLFGIPHAAFFMSYTLHMKFEVSSTLIKLQNLETQIVFHYKRNLTGIQNFE